MTAVVAQPAPAQVAEGPFEIGYLSEDGAEHRVSLEDAWLVRFESARPVRRFAARKGQRHLSGLWWCATTSAHVGFESWLERDHVVALDFDRAVSRPDIGLAMTPTVASATSRWRLTRQPLACCSPIALPARRRRACRLRDTRFRSR